MTLYAIGMLTLSSEPAWPILLAATLLMGCGWMATLTTLNATAQITLPSRLRARGMGCYLTMMAGSMSLGSFVWGQTAGAIGMSGAMLASGIAMIATAMISLLFPLAATLDDA